MKIPHYPILIENMYSRLVMKRIKSVFSVIKKTIQKKAPGLFSIVRDFISGLHEAKDIVANNPFSKRKLQEVANLVERFAKKQFSRSAGYEVLGGKFPIGGWVGQQATMISTLERFYFDDLEKNIAALNEIGLTRADIWKKIHERTKVSIVYGDNNAAIAVARLHCDATKFNHQSAGVTHYIWSSRRDGKVRPWHVAREGVIFAWNNAPFDGHPGWPERCRCVAIPIFEAKRIIKEMIQ